MKRLNGPNFCSRRIANPAGAILDLLRLFSLFLSMAFIILAVSSCGPGLSPTSTPLPPTQTPPGTDYYVDSVNGQDSNSGLSPSLAWQTLTPMDDHTFEPGDTIYFNITVAHNISDDYQQFIAWDTTTRPSDFLVEHNTVIRTHPENACPLFTVFYYREKGPAPDESWLAFRNNIFYTTWQPVLDNADYPCNYPHEHNLFYAPAGSAISDPVGYPPGPGDIIADPQFADFSARDLHLQPSSPAINMGTDLEYTSDYNSNPMPVGSAPDAGAYEYQGDD